LCHSLEGLACQIHLPSQSILQIKKWCLTQTTGMGRGDGRRPTLVGGERDGMERGGGRARRGEGAEALTPLPTTGARKQSLGRDSPAPLDFDLPSSVGACRPSQLPPGHLGSSVLGLGPPAPLDLGLPAWPSWLCSSRRPRCLTATLHGLNPEIDI
jgi:hypothetical protein